ncbi:MAG: BatA domain-containing protein, partial [Lentisphaeraceae bacterium]|nr:BatA domain-containing protein [Lentisphaeraceae bacterium]
MSFAAPLLLAGLAAIAVPVILHLMAREVPKTIHFPTLRFITRDKLETHSKRGIRDLLLLLLRCLIVAGIVLAFAKPFIESTPVDVAVAEKQTVVLLDASASMNRPEVLQIVKDKLSEEIGSSEVTALVVSSQGIVAKYPFAAKEEFFSNLFKVKMTDFEGHHETALNEAASLFSEKSKVKKIILVSDFQQNDWTFSQMPQIDKSIEVKFIKAFEAFPANVSLTVDRVRRLKKGQIIQAQALLENHNTDKKDIEVKIASGRKSVSEKVELAGLEKRRIILTLENPDSDKALVSINEDDFPLDDRYHIWIGDQAPIPVVIPESGENKSLDYIFVQKALEAVRAGDASFRVSTAEAELFSSVDLDEARVLVLNDSAFQIRSEEYEGIKKFVEKGGLLIAAPGEKAGILLSRLKAYGLADVNFDKLMTRKNRSDIPFRFSQMDEKSNLLKMFTETPDSDIQNFSIYRYNRFTVGGAVKNLLEIEKGIPGIVINPLGKGSVIISAIPFNHVWSDFTLSNSFLPFLRNTIVSLSGDSINSILKLNVGDKKAKPGEMAIGEDNFIDTSKAGSQVINEVPVVVNYSRKESQTETVNIIDFKNKLRASEGSRITVKGEKETGSEYWHIFILLALAALFGEFALADLF